MAQHDVLWFVIADGGKLRVVVRNGKALHTEHSFDALNRRDRSTELGSDRPGRDAGPSEGQRHPFEPKTDPHELEKRRFAEDVARFLNDAGARDECRRIVLVAPPPISNAIQDELDKATAAKVIGTVSKDLTNVPDHELAPHFADWPR